MKKIGSIILTAVIIVLSLSFIATKDKEKIDYYTIQECLDSNFIQVEVSGNGGYQEECVILSVKNISSQDLKIKLEPGRRLISDDSTVQDILIVKEKQFLLAVGASFDFKGYGFCCQNYNSAPKKDSAFDIGYVENENFVKLANVINENNFPANAIQHAIWVLSDSISFSSVRTDNMEDIKILRNTLADILNIEIPWYTLSYVQDTARLFSDRPKIIKGNFKYYVKNNSIITINVRNSNGQIVKVLVKEVAKNPGAYDHYLDMNVANWRKGKYSIFVYADYSNIILKKEFVL
ncbi:MAG: hypothetical protein U9Q83_04440 [Bacteroidota bacterium]|nr:hypothetical protein [Bacteroidota bacterium]